MVWSSFYCELLCLKMTDGFPMKWSIYAADWKSMSIRFWLDSDGWTITGFTIICLWSKSTKRSCELERRKELKYFKTYCWNKSSLRSHECIFLTAASVKTQSFSVCHITNHSMVRGFQIIYSSFLVHPLSKTYTWSVAHLFSLQLGYMASGRCFYRSLF